MTYFYESFSTFKPQTLALQNILDTLSDVLDKCLCFSRIKIEPVSINPKPNRAWCLPIYFSIKMLSLVLIKN